MTIRTPDDIGLQLAWDYSSDIIMPAIRIGQGGVWLDWLSRTFADLAPANGWVAYAGDTTLRASKSWKMVTLSGEVKSGTTTTGTVVTALPAGMRPYANQRVLVPCGASFDQVASIQIQPGGNVVIQTCPSNAGLSLDSITFEAFN